MEIYQQKNGRMVLKHGIKNDKLHRDGDLPAVEYSHGDKYWYRNGKLHRDGDLPAVLWAYGYKEWWKNGVRYYPS